MDLLNFIHAAERAFRAQPGVSRVPRQMRHVLGWISNNRSHLVEVSWRSR